MNKHSSLRMIDVMPHSTHTPITYNTLSLSKKKVRVSNSDRASINRESEMVRRNLVEYKKTQATQATQATQVTQSSQIAQIPQITQSTSSLFDRIISLL